MDRGDTGQRMVNMELSGMKKGRRQQRSFKDVVKEDVQRFGVTEEGSRDRGQRKKVKNSQTCRAFTLKPEHRRLQVLSAVSDKGALP